MIESLDQNVGRLLAALEEMNLMDKTIIVFTSDNGGIEYEAYLPRFLHVMDGLSSVDALKGRLAASILQLYRVESLQFPRMDMPYHFVV